MSFLAFSAAVAAQFERMGKGELFDASVEKDSLWATYIESFPEGSNPILRKRTEHDCSCCRSFIKNIGGVVSISPEGKITTVWDVTLDNPVYQTVANALAALVRANPVRGLFLYPETRAGVSRNYEVVDGKTLTWDHFSVEIPYGRNTGTNHYAKREDITSLRVVAYTNYQVFFGGLEKIRFDALDTVLELIGQNAVYRGDEKQKTIEKFLKLKKKFDALPEESRDNFVWQHANITGNIDVARLKNSTMGVLLLNLSESMELETALNVYEKMMDASNFNRPTSLVTQEQVEKARQKIEELGFTSALKRRYARLADISINNVLFANRDTGKAMKGGDVFDTIPTKAAKHTLDGIQNITIDAFLADVLPKATTVELMFDNKHTGNLMSLIAPVDPTAKNLFKWDNGFSWSYAGDFADSSIIKERVKKAGGNVTGELCCRLSWFNHDDLDFHMQEPGHKICYRSKISASSGGKLDVDMNAGGGTTREPVENIFYEKITSMPNGNYMLSVDNFCKRENTNIGFDIEIDHLGDVITMQYRKAVADRQTIDVAKIVKSANGVEITPLLPASNVSQLKWGLKTLEFHPVNSIMLSPNYWPNQDGEVRPIGQKHFFFMLDKCVNDGVARGFYNDFLHPSLIEHRKVLEMVGQRTKTEESDDQLSGLGFSSTKRAEVVVRVTGAVRRTLKIVF